MEARGVGDHFDLDDLPASDREAECPHQRSLGSDEIPLAGVFTTRSPHRPNPLGLHRVTVREISGTRLRIGPIEAIDGTPASTSSQFSSTLAINSATKHGRVCPSEAAY
jgi:tRNA (Thr-GGU) A37 N-methylase